MRQQFFCIFLILLATFFAAFVHGTEVKRNIENQEKVTATDTVNINEFYDLKIRILNNAQPNAANLCRYSGEGHADWQKVTFKDLPQNQHFCLRAAINIDQKTLSSNPILFLGMLASASLYWDEQPLAKNGVVGRSKSNEIPGSIKILTRIPERQLTTGKHILSAEMSTFYVGRELKAIGYILDIVDEQKLNYLILMISMVSGVFLGVLLILSIIFQLIYWLYQQKNSYLLFSLFCFISATLLLIEQAKFWLDYSYDWHNFRLLAIYLLTLCVSFLLPFFYIYQYQLPQRRNWVIAVMLSLFAVSVSNQDYDTTSNLLFSCSLFWALVINFYQVKQSNKGKVDLVVILIGLSSLIVIPEYYSEVGFGLIFICFVIMILITQIKEMRLHKEQSLKAERVKTELLRRNMQPHFLMNCLTQLMELIEVKPKEAIVLVSALSDEFKQLTTQSEQGSVSLLDEINLCHKHLKIMSLRYQQHYQLTTFGNIENINVPSSILHSQIENCFTHNHISTDRAFELYIEDNRENIHLTLKTPIEKKVNHKGTGIGERYINAKLAEISQTKTTFKSYQEGQYWLSIFTYPNIHKG